MWPLDLSIAALAGLVLFLVVTRLRFDDPRWHFNGWTYAVAVPVVAMLLAVFSHGLVNRRVHKSIQLGFLFSVFLHLLLILLAINVVIFSRFFPDAFASSKPDRPPVRHTVPEYIFQIPKKESAVPDWSRPVDADTAARVLPREAEQLPKTDYVRPKTEIPTPVEPQPVVDQKHLFKRETSSESMPQPTDRPAKLARREPASSTLPSARPVAPALPAPETPERREPERRIRQDSRAIASTPARVSLPTTPLKSHQIAPLSAASPRRNESMPIVGTTARQKPRQAAAPVPPRAAGAAPSPPTVSIARESMQASRIFAPDPVVVTRPQTALGAQVAMSKARDVAAPSRAPLQIGSNLRRDVSREEGGMPSIAEGDSRRVGGRLSNQGNAVGFAPLGAPEPNAAAASIAAADPSEPDAAISDRLDSEPNRRGSRVPATLSNVPVRSGDLTPAVEPDALDSIGLWSQDDGEPGLTPPQPNAPRVAALDVSRGRRPRREVGGPVTPLGADIAAVRTFRRRVMRTLPGATPTPAGEVGPATEQAIERGLAYLANTQNTDGSWSLQGHGGNVLLRSDTAATGLCLLAFQGAGYTHQQHQYAETVRRGLDYLVTNQKTSGDLYRSENRISDQNVALYSHGIAALAVCEAYGMSRDPNLRGPAQRSLDYIAGTQHSRRGGWRYTPQISSDTSVTGWMMMALKSGELSGLEVSAATYEGIQKWLRLAQSPGRPDRYRYNPFAPDTPSQRHGRQPTPTMTSVGMLMRMYLGWRRDTAQMRSAADYLLRYPPQMGTERSPQRDVYYWYYATQVMFHMGESRWRRWNDYLKPLLLDSQIKVGPRAGSWDPSRPVPDRWGAHAGRLYVTAMNLLNLEVYYRHLPIYDDTAD